MFYIEVVKETFLTILRDKTTNLRGFREAARNLCALIAAEAALQIPLSPHPIETPLAPAKGAQLNQRIVLLPILRAGMVFLPPFLDLFPDAPVGFFGMRREEKTARPFLYYENLPPLSPTDRIFLLDPMLATGGSATLALRKLHEKKVNLSNLTLVTILAAKPGIAAVQKAFPQVTIYAAAIDEALDQNHFIVPGLGDFGDRFFGTELQRTDHSR